MTVPISLYSPREDSSYLFVVVGMLIQALDQIPQCARLPALETLHKPVVVVDTGLMFICWGRETVLLQVQVNYNILQK